MKTLVLYASKYGCTEDCVHYLKDKINHPVKVANLKNLGTIDLNQYDCIIIGGSIYVGKLQKEVQVFCKKHLPLLLTKNIALFMCCTTPEQTDDFFKHNFPAKLQKHAKTTVNFGGELRENKMGFFDKKISAMVSKHNPKKPEILYINIDQLAMTINSL